MNKLLIIATGAALALANVAFAKGDAEKGEKAFKKCKACHKIADGDEVLFKGGKTGPNLFGIVGRPVAGEDFKYGGSIAALGETGMVWTEELLAEYVADPKAFLQTHLDDDSAKSKMTFKLKSGGEDVAAFLATFSAAE